MERDTKELLKTYDDLEEQYKLLMKQVNKAIEYINNLQSSDYESQRDFNKNIDFGIYETDNLLDILRGKDNE